MEIEPSTNLSQDLTREPYWWRFKANNVANPHGRSAPKVRINAEAERLIHEFVSIYGRPPSHSESVTISNAALLICKLAARGRGGKAQTPEDIAKLSNSVTRCLRLVGLARAPSRVAA